MARRPPAVPAAPAGPPARNRRPGNTRLAGTARVTGPPRHRLARRRTEDIRRIEKRRRKAWHLWCSQDLTFRELGARLGVSNKTAHEDVVAVLNALREAGLADAETLRDRHAAIGRQVIGAHLKKKDRAESARIVLDGLAREARLYGLDKQRDGMVPVEQVTTLLRMLVADLLATFVDAAQRRAIEAAFRKRLGAGVIDVQPAKDQDL